jgi:glutamate-1-semialdehyde 2,1-aminomutase
VGRSEELFERASKVIPGGVNSPVRAFRAVGGTPRFVVGGDGAWIQDVDARRYVDYVQSWGALLFGHARAEIVEAAVRAARNGTSFGAPTELEVRLAERIVAMVPSVEEVRLVSSGTEACMSAVRLARAKAGSGVATFGLPGTKGVTPGATADTVVLPYNDPAAALEAFSRHGPQVAAVIVEPVAANVGVVPPLAGFLDGLRHLTTEHGALLIFDEVITGFRLAPGGAQELFGVRPDLTTLGKVMGGGFPCAAFGGSRELMEHLAPVGPVYQAGTLSGNPVAVAAGLAALELVQDEDPYPTLRARAERLADGLASVFRASNVPFTINRVESLFSVFFGSDAVADYQGAKRADHRRYARFFHAMLDEGVHLPPSGYEAWFLSTAHGQEEIDRTVEAAGRAARATG